MDQLPC